MAIAFENATTTDLSTTGTSLTYAFDVGTEDNLILFVGSVGNLTDTLTGITYAGKALVEIGKTQSTSDRWSYLYYLDNGVDSGSNNVVISQSASTFMTSLASAYSGAKQSQTLDTDIKRTSSTTGAATTVDSTVTTEVDNSWHLQYARSRGSNPSAAVGTQRDDEDNTWSIIIDTNGAITPAGVNTLTAQSNSGVWTEISASFAPAVASASRRRIPMMII